MAISRAYYGVLTGPPSVRIRTLSSPDGGRTAAFDQGRIGDYILLPERMECASTDQPSPVNHDIKQ